MSIASTSLEAFNDIQATGKSQKQVDIIMDVLLANKKPLTGREIQQKTDLDINAISGRLNEMKSVGLVTTCGKTKCPITKRTVVPVTAVWNKLELYYPQK
tara:strand:- start:156 stop:455 length:300 start_codon:yes stop_codon:yes gene_type:complete